MKKSVLVLFLLGNYVLLNANKVYTINDDEYKKYKDNPKEMLSLFKKKFLKIQEEKIIVKNTIVEVPKVIEKKAEVKTIVKIPKVITPEIKIEETQVSEVKKVVVPSKIEKKAVLVEKKALRLDKKIVKKKSKITEEIVTLPIIKKSLVKIKNKKNIEKEVTKVTKTIKNKKKNRTYIMTQVIKKLNYTNIVKEKNIELLISRIDNILTRKNISYDNDEVAKVLKNINLKKMSSFESKVYLEQITNLIKG